MHMKVCRKMNQICLDCLNPFVLSSVHVTFIRPLFFWMFRLFLYFVVFNYLVPSCDRCTWGKRIETHAHERMRFPSVICGDSSSVVYLSTMCLPWWVVNHRLAWSCCVKEQHLLKEREHVVWHGIFEDLCVSHALIIHLFFFTVGENRATP